MVRLILSIIGRCKKDLNPYPKEEQKMLMWLKPPIIPPKVKK